MFLFSPTINNLHQGKYSINLLFKYMCKGIRSRSVVKYLEYDQNSSGGGGVGVYLVLAGGVYLAPGGGGVLSPRGVSAPRRGVSAWGVSDWGGGV